MIEIIKATTMDIVDLRGLAEEGPLRNCLTNSRMIYQAKVSGKVACIWGLIPPTIMSDNAYIWLYTTPIADEHTFLLVRYSQRMVQSMLEEFEALTGHCKINDDRAIRWMRWLGADFGPYQDKVIPFIIRRKHG